MPIGELSRYNAVDLRLSEGLSDWMHNYNPVRFMETGVLYKKARSDAMLAAYGIFEFRNPIGIC